MSLIDRAARSLKDPKKSATAPSDTGPQTPQHGPAPASGTDRADAEPYEADEESVLEESLEFEDLEDADSFAELDTAARGAGTDDAQTGEVFARQGGAAATAATAGADSTGATVPPGGGHGAPGAEDAGPSGPRSRRFSIDCDALALEGYITPQSRQGPIAEEIRLIKRRLLREMPSLHGTQSQAGAVDNVLMVTSAEPAEGKTFTTVNLGLSFAVDEGFDVLLIDADVNNPALGRKLGLPEAAPGLIDLLTDESLSMPDVLHRDADLRISVMGVGSQVPSATELFGSALMQEFVDHVAQRYPDRVIIFDAPPVLASTEPMVLSQAMGLTLLVVGANRTQKDTVKSAVELLEPADNVRLVLNRMPAFTTERFGRSYSYGSN